MVMRYALLKNEKLSLKIKRAMTQSANKANSIKLNLNDELLKYLKFECNVQNSFKGSRLMTILRHSIQLVQLF